VSGEPYDNFDQALAAMFQNRDGVQITSRLRAEIERDPMYRAWQVLRESAARDWDRWLGTGEIPPAFRRPEPEPVDPHTEALALHEGATLARAAAGAVPTGALGGHVRDLAPGCSGWVPDSWTVAHPQPPLDPHFDLYGAAREMHQAMAAAPPFVPWGPA
jgi:hypothetical protein